MTRRCVIALGLLVACARAAPRPPAVPRVEPRVTGLVLDPTPARLERVVSHRWSSAFDERHYVSGGLRVEVREGAVAFAEDETATAIVRVAEVEGGWVFFAADGLVAASETFTGRLRVIGSTPTVAVEPVLRRSSGRAAIVARGALWTSDGRSLVAVDVLGQPVVAAAFADARFGAAALADGALALTRDGGAHWERVALGGDLALDVVWSDRLRVSLVSRHATLGPDGTLAAAPRSRERSSASEVEDALSARDAAAGRFALPSGAWIGVTESAIEVGGARGRRFSLPLGSGSVLGLRSGSQVRRWGGGLAVVAEEWYRFDPDGRLTLLRGPDGTTRFPNEDLSVVWSDDNRHAAWTGVCPIVAPRAEGAAEAPDEAPPPDEDVSEEDTPERADEAPALCVLDDGLGRWRKVALPDAQTAGLRWALVGLHGARALLKNELDASEYATFDLDRDQRGGVRLRDPSVALTSLGWVADGSLCGTGERCGDGCEPVVVRGLADGPLDATPAPAALSDVAFADALHGAARSADGTTLWRTLDGGRSWERVADDLPNLEALDASLECGATGCDLGHRVHLRGWGPLRARDAVLTLASPRAREPAEAPARERPPEESPSVTEVRCTDDGRARRSPWSVRGEARQAWPEGVGSFARRDAASLVATWRGRDGGGAVTFPAPRESRGEARPGVNFLAASSGAALVATAMQEVLWLDRGGARSVTHPATREPLRFGTELDVARAPDGSVALLYAGDTSPRSTQVFALDAGGAVRSWRAFFQRPREGSAMAFHQGRWGHVTGGASAARFEALEGSEPLALPAWHGSMRACASAAATTGAVTLYVRACGSYGLPCVRPTSSAGVERERLVVELSPAGACVRAVYAELRWYDENHARRSTWQLAAEGGALVGFDDDGARRQGVRCVHP